MDKHIGPHQAIYEQRYCAAHLLREVEDIGKEFSESEEGKTFVGVLAPFLTTAMNLSDP